MQAVYARRRERGWRARLYRALQPPALFVRNPREPLNYPLGRWGLAIGGAGSRPAGCINLDLLAIPGVDVAGDAEQLPFRSGRFQRIECDAVLEHVRRPGQAMREMARVLAPGDYLHVVTPFCHPFHAYPDDYRRFTLEGLKQLARDEPLAGDRLEVVAEGWRTVPTATMLVFFLEYVKLPWHAWRVIAHGVLGWLLFPLRYLDLLFFRTVRAAIIGNHCYLWLRKR